MPVTLERETLSVHILNVGDGDAIVIELPEVGGDRGHIVVDSFSITNFDFSRSFNARIKVSSVDPSSIIKISKFG